MEVSPSDLGWTHTRLFECCGNAGASIALLRTSAAQQEKQKTPPPQSLRAHVAKKTLTAVNLKTLQQNRKKLLRKLVGSGAFIINMQETFTLHRPWKKIHERSKLLMRRLHHQNKFGFLIKVWGILCLCSAQYKKSNIMLKLVRVLDQNDENIWNIKCHDSAKFIYFRNPSTILHGPLETNIYEYNCVKMWAIM